MGNATRTFPSYTKVLTICSTSSGPRSTCDSLVCFTKSHTSVSVTAPFDLIAIK